MAEGVRDSATAWLTIATSPRVGCGIGTAIPTCFDLRIGEHLVDAVDRAPTARRRH